MEASLGRFGCARGLGAESGAQLGRNRKIIIVMRQCCVAALFVTIALGFTLLFQRFFYYPFLFFFFGAVIASAWLCGEVAGLVAVLLSSAATAYFFLPPIYSFGVHTTEIGYFIGFIACALAASWVSSNRRQTQAALWHAQNKFEALVECVSERPFTERAEHPTETAKAGDIAWRYGLAILSVGVALGMTFLLQHLFVHPFLFLFFAAVMASAWFGGTEAGFIAVLLSTAAVDYFFLSPVYSWRLEATEGAYFAGYVMCSAAAAWISANRRQAYRALEHAGGRMQALVTQKTAELEYSRAELQESDRWLRLLAELMPRSGQPLSKVLDDVVGIAASMVSCDSCLLYVLEKDELALRASKNPHPDVVDRLKLKIGQGITGWVAEHKQPVAVEKDAFEDPRFQMFDELPEDKFEAFLSVPLLSRGRLVGVINMQNRVAHSYSEREIYLLSTIGFLVGAEIETARLENDNAQAIQKLEDRKIIERVKGVIQRELGVDEEEAYLTLQRQSRISGKPMREIAEAILLTNEITQVHKPDRPQGVDSAPTAGEGSSRRTSAIPKGKDALEKRTKAAEDAWKRIPPWK